MLSCRVRSNPLPLIEWTKDDLPIKLDERIQQTESYEGLCELFISKPTSDDNGVYACIATNNIGCIEQEHAVFYPQLVDKIKTICLEPQEEEPEVLPALIGADGAVTVPAEIIDAKTLVADPVAYVPDAPVDDVIKPVEPEPVTEPEPEPEPPKKPRRINPLTILDADPNYERRHVLPTLEQMQRELRQKITFVTHLKDRFFPLGQPAKLSVLVKGPDPNAKWSKDGQQIANGPIYHMNAKNGLFTMEIVNCTPEMAGTYSVTVRNQDSSATCSMQLQLYAPEIVADSVPTFTRNLKRMFDN